MEFPSTFPSLLPKVADPVWFCVDKPCDDENELTKLEEGHKLWLQSIAENKSDTPPIGKTSDQLGEDDDDEEDEDADVDDESDTNDDDELDTDMIDDRDSPDETEMEGNDQQIDAAPWGL